MARQKVKESQDSLEEKNKAGRYIPPAIKSFYKATSLNIVHMERQADRWNRIECAETEAHICGH